MPAGRRQRRNATGECGQRPLCLHAECLEVRDARPAGHRPQGLQILRGQYRQARLRIAQQVLELGGAAGDIDGDEYGPEPQAGEVKHHRLDGFLGAHRNPVPRQHPALGQRRGKLRRLRLQRGVAERAARGSPEEHALWMLARGARNPLCGVAEAAGRGVFRHADDPSVRARMMPHAAPLAGAAAPSVRRRRRARQGALVYPEMSARGIYKRCRDLRLTRAPLQVADDLVGFNGPAALQIAVHGGGER